MEIRALLRDDDAVSPVIGVILMVGITVILAAVTGSFVLGLGEPPETPPQAGFEFDYRSGGVGSLDISHTGGDNIEPDRLAVASTEAVNPAPGNDSGSPAAGVSRVGLDSEADGSPWVDSEVRAGTSVTVVSGTAGNGVGAATVRVVYVGASGERTATLAEWEGPDA